MKDIYEELKSICEIDSDIPLSKMTTLRIGGVAKYVAYPENSLSLEGVIKKLKENEIPYKVIGKGSNLLCSDDPFDGVIIRLDRYFCDAYYDNNQLVAEAGCSIIALSYEAMKNEFSGLEFASGIPGTVGGVTFMNAGAYKSSMADIIDSVSVFHDGMIEWLSNKDCEFSYRTSIFQKHPDWIILAVKMNLTKANQQDIRDLMDSRRERRMNSQPLDKPSAGSVFRNPNDVPAWKLIEGAGYRGKRIGDAVVSSKHVNFIVNDGHATANDFITLVNEVQKAVKDKYNIDLYMEVEKFNWR